MTIIRGAAGNKVPATFNAADYGAVGDGVTNDSTAIQAAINAASAAGSGVVVGKGSMHGNTYRCLTGLSLPNNVHLRDMRFDFSAMTTDVSGAAIYSAGSLTSLPALSANIAKGALTITFASAPSVVAGDVLVIYNSTDSTFNTARTVYRAGEMVRVKSVASTTVTITNHTYDAYTSGGTTAVYKMTPTTNSVTNVKAALTTGSAGIKFVNGVGCSVDNVDLSGSGISHVAFSQCYETTARNVRAIDFSSAATGVNYGIAITSCQRCEIIGGYTETSRHGISLGTDGNTGGVPNREITITGATISSNSTDAGVNGFDCHGNVEHIKLTGCTLPHGMGFGGDHVEITGCHIASGVGGIAIYGAEMLGTNYHLADNTFLASESITSGFGMCDFQFDTECTRSNGTFRFVDNYINMQDKLCATPANGTWPLYVRNIAASSNNNDVVIQGNTVMSTASTQSPVYMRVRGNTSKSFRRVTMRNNTMRNVGLSAEGLSAEFLQIAGNEVDGALEYGISTSPVATPAFSTSYITLENNFVLRAQLTGINLTGATSTVARVVGNTSINNVQKAGGTGSAITDSSIFLSTLGTAILQENVFGDSQGSPTQQRAYGATAITTLYERNNHTVGITTITTSSITTELDGYVNQSRTRHGHGTAAPTSGAWVVGDVIWHSTPAASGNIGWVCTTAGSPGVWKTFGTIAA